LTFADFGSLMTRQIAGWATADSSKKSGKELIMKSPQKMILTSTTVMALLAMLVLSCAGCSGGGGGSSGSSSSATPETGATPPAKISVVTAK
jgi:hypothetical protein